ncbi:MAG: nucleotidyltransferase domain-containing protein [Coriobacteriales bacterium]|nr:nucleotidyltransferase domain-containing protein [Coriobacteriales bacterium]
MSNHDEHIVSQMELTFRLTDTPTAQESVLAFLLDAAGDQFTEVELRRIFDLPKSTLHLSLSNLVEGGLVVRENVGRTGVYSVDTSDPLVRTLKLARAIAAVQRVIKPLKERLDLVVLFGSASRGENRATSDVDVLVIAQDRDYVEAELARHQWLQPVVMTPAEHMTLIAEGGTFAKETAGGLTILERT